MSSVTTSHPHISGLAGWLSPFSGSGHVLAMLSVGAWGRQMGWQAARLVPATFVCFMLLMGLTGFEYSGLMAPEITIPLSIVLPGFAIAVKHKPAVVIASALAGLSGIFHGYEIPLMQNKAAYTAGFLAATVVLHLTGILGSHLMMKINPGEQWLRLLGLLSALCGICFLATAV